MIVAAINRTRQGASGGYAPNVSSTSKLLRRHGSGILENLGLNKTGTINNLDLKLKDVRRAALKESRPVMHLAEVLYERCIELRRLHPMLDKRELCLAPISDNYPWVWEAIAKAETRRLSNGRADLLGFQPSDLIELRREKPGDNTPSEGMPAGI